MARHAEHHGLGRRRHRAGGDLRPLDPRLRHPAPGRGVRRDRTRPRACSGGAPCLPSRRRQGRHRHRGGAGASPGQPRRGTRGAARRPATGPPRRCCSCWNGCWRRRDRAAGHGRAGAGFHPVAAAAGGLGGRRPVHRLPGPAAAGRAGACPPAWLACIAVFGWGQPVNPLWPAIFALLQLLRVWILATLGPRWTTRIIGLDEPLVRRGPFRFLRHPNHTLVVDEIAVAPMVLGLVWVAVVFSILNALV
nr:isoprenylcysteine carboxylmethyltransferase family protein [Paracoccus sphaerophysae]